ncbi:hypothetical protein C7448_102252 [Tenacibaculum gallaicum]|uniref:Uncharacterized protein n=1 Tax=Tenacibaculum gallaicum TaxID=561505 RepID=A0A3E0I7I9_9FLAO|nr:hypothetical protein [Tenacibaculum gallaicum]REH54728.1 hypothetical protein C7448_102252 [Tenacibaculum gallaicum]
MKKIILVILMINFLNKDSFKEKLHFEASLNNNGFVKVLFINKGNETIKISNPKCKRFYKLRVFKSSEKNEIFPIKIYHPNLDCKPQYVEISPCDDFLVDGLFNLYDLYNLKKEINYRLEISYTGYVRISNKQRKVDLKSEFIINTK